jgi:hypothetical protein
MLKKSIRPWLGGALIVLLLLAIGWLAFSDTEVGMANVTGFENARLSQENYSRIPQDVIDDASELAAEIAGDSQEAVQDLVDEMLTVYLEAKESDVMVVFNSGGWGWNMIEETPGWASILDGIKGELEGMGYKALVVNYRRTGTGLKSCLNEFFEEGIGYPKKSEQLARRLEFITGHNPDLKVIVAGESTGTILTDTTMERLKDNPKVYSIQTGAPFWHEPMPLERSLLINSNGDCEDTFARGNVPAMVWSTFKNCLGLLSPEKEPGTVLSWLRAPGHHYSWQHPGVANSVGDFLKMNFGAGG